MDFVEYQHIERFRNSKVEDIELGECFIFPKIDGTNASVWIDDGEIKAGSRKRILSEDNDNAGFYKWVQESKPLRDYLIKNPTHRLHGEWLVPHTLKTYKEDAWRKFYIFDVSVDIDDGIKYIPYNDYKNYLDEFSLDYIQVMNVIKNPSYEQLTVQLEKNDFLIEEGKGYGEGIVIKNYEFVNKYGRQVFAKIVTSEFKEKHLKVMGNGIVIGSKMKEYEIVDNFITKALCEKVEAKIRNENNGDFSGKDIPRLLNTVFYDLINEEMWTILKEYKNPKINFKTLQSLTFKKVKQHLLI